MVKLKCKIEICYVFNESTKTWHHDNTFINQQFSTTSKSQCFSLPKCLYCWCLISFFFCFCFLVRKLNTMQSRWRKQREEPQSLLLLHSLFFVQSTDCCPSCLRALLSRATTELAAFDVDNCLKKNVRSSWLHKLGGRRGVSAWPLDDTRMQGLILSHSVIKNSNKERQKK